MSTKKDLLFSLVTGFYTGFIAWRIFTFLNVPLFRDISFAWLMVLVPVLWILGVNLGYFLGRWFGFFNQFGKFAAIGFTNAAVDFGILNLLIFYSGIAAGVWFSVFKGISFIAGATHSYFWNKYWVFEVGKNGVNGNEAIPASREPIAWKEFFKFLSVTVVALFINVIAASIVVNLVGSQFGLSSEVWANVGAVVGSAVALMVSFVGFRAVVFKKR